MKKHALSGPGLLSAIVFAMILSSRPSVSAEPSDAAGRIRTAGAESGQAIKRSAQTHDWPMWRYDSRRLAAAPEALPEPLYPHWVLELPPPRRAWPEQIDDQGKLAFDTAYEPVAAGGRLFVPSMVHDSVTAYDLDSGDEKWRYYTDGPVRLAPAYDRGRLYVASDDGHLYCLEASSGELIWRFRAVPSERKVLGNERLISMWPVRGAPVVHDGVVYFAAGVWPFEGVYVYALDAVSAEVIWVHSGSGRYSSDAYSEAARSFSTISPQGYLAAAGELLIVSGGRTTPARFNRRTGELLYFDRVHSRGGGYAVSGEWRDSESDVWYGFQLFRQPPERRFRIQTGDQIHDYSYWSERIGEKVWRLLAADQRLIAVTENGRVHVFGPGERRTIVHSRDRALPPRPDDEWRGRVAQLLRGTGESDGYALLFGIGSGRLLDELLFQSDLHITAFDPDPVKVTIFRERYARAGLYGRRVAVHQGDALSNRLPPYIASLVVSEDPVAAGLKQGAPFVQAIFNSLRPYGGAAYLVLDQALRPDMSAALKNAALEQARFRYGDDFLLFQRQGPLPGAASWSHQYADAANTAYSSEDNVRPPLGITWFGGTTNEKTLPRHMFGPVPQVVAGRLIIMGINHLSARSS